MSTRKSFWKDNGPLVGGVVLVSLFLLGVVYLFLQLEPGAPPREVQEQEISVVLPPPPPPPPEPPEPEPPEEEIEEVEEEPEPEPEPDPEPIEASDEPPPDAGPDIEGYGDGGAGGFKIGGGGSGGGGDPKKYYAFGLKRDLEAALAKIEGLKSAEYVVTLKIFVNADGTIASVDLVRGSGNREVDRLMETELAGIRVERVPPEDMQPITLRIRSKS